MKTLVVLVFAGLLLSGEMVMAKPISAGGSVDDVAIELMCQCGCRLVLPACNMPECSIQKKMMDQIRYMYSEQGQSKDQIVKYFLDNYGEEVLAAPTKKGFNLTAWLTPFAAISAGLGFVYVVVDQWVMRKGRRSTDEESVEEEVSPAELPMYEEWLREELDDREGGA